MKQPSSSSSRTHVFVKLFVGFHLLAVLVWTLPRPAPEIESGVRSAQGSDFLLIWNDSYLRPSPLKWYVGVTGTWQYWDMFAPDPATRDWWCDGTITLADGETKPFSYPRMTSLSPSQKFLKERYRKFYERLHLPANRPLWTQFARRIADEGGSSPKNRAVRVQILHHWKDVAGPGGRDAGPQSIVLADVSLAPGASQR